MFPNGDFPFATMTRTHQLSGGENRPKNWCPCLMVNSHHFCLVKSLAVGKKHQTQKKTEITQEEKYV
jgi:hypothetical protein